MKMTKRWMVRSVAAVSLVVAGVGMTGCGDKSSDPEAVDVTVLKAPGKLRLHDDGNGQVTLMWEAGINNPDFDGFNVYGMKAKTADPADDLGVTVGEPIELLDGEGNPNAAARTILESFNYDTASGYKLEKAGTKEAAAEGEDAPQFEALPIHTLAADEDKKPYLPTCKVNAAGVCIDTVAANFEKNVGDEVASVNAANGVISYVVKDLKVGSQYCFFVLSSMDAGEKVSSTSTNVECVTPSYSGEFDLAMPTSTSNSTWKLTDYRAACEAANECEAPATAVYVAGSATSHNAASTDEVYIEYSSSAGPSFVAGKNSGVIDIGYFEAGFADPNLDLTAPTMKLDTNVYTNGSVEAPIFNGGGYSSAGASVALIKNHVYVIAVGDASETAPKKFLYVWLWVKGDISPTATSATVAVMMPKAVR